MSTARTSQPYSLTELVFALGLLAILMACFHTSYRVVSKQNQVFGDETRALQVIDNTVERLSVRESYTGADIEAVFQEEYGKSGLSVGSRYRPTCTQDSHTAILTVLRKNGRALVRIKLRCSTG